MNMSIVESSNDLNTAFVSIKLSSDDSIHLETGMDIINILEDLINGIKKFDIVEKKLSFPHDITIPFNTNYTRSKNQIKEVVKELK